MQHACIRPSVVHVSTIFHLHRLDFLFETVLSLLLFVAVLSFGWLVFWLAVCFCFAWFVCGRLFWGVSFRVI